MLSTIELQGLLCKQIAWWHDYICENIEVEGIEYDVLAISKSLMLYEFETKISRSDFLADAKKDKWVFRNAGLKNPNYMFYVCEGDLIKPEELPNKIGLLSWDGKRFVEMKRASILHRNRIVTDKLLLKIIRLHTNRKYLGGARLTIENKIRRESRKQHELWRQDYDSICDICGKTGGEHEYPNTKCI